MEAVQGHRTTAESNGHGELEDDSPLVTHRFAVSGSVTGDQVDSSNVEGLLQAIEAFSKQHVRTGQQLILDFSGIRIISASASRALADFFFRFLRGSVAHRGVVDRVRSRMRNAPLYLSLHGLTAADARDTIHAAVEELDDPKLIIPAPRPDEPEELTDRLAYHTVGSWGSIARTSSVFAVLWECVRPLAPQEIKPLAEAIDERAAEQIHDYVRHLHRYRLIARLDHNRYYRVR